MRPLGRFVFLLALGGAGVGICLAALIPGVSTLAAAQHFTGDAGSRLKPLSSDTVVYAADGSVLDRLGDQDRTPVKLSDVPKTLIDAVIATEDKTFYQNAGVDLSSTVRALASNVGSGGVTQGGSTITQQLVKNRVKSVGTKRDLTRKIKEAILAYRLNDRYSKNYILEQYLNTVYFGELSYGVSSAALRFFGKPLSQLTLADSALLAGVISSPSSYDPFTHPKLAKQRQVVVLKHMLSQHYITKVQAAVAALTPLPVNKPPAEALRPNSYYVEAVQEAILKDTGNKFGLGKAGEDRRKKLLNGGLKIYTAEEPARQTQAENAFKSAVTGDWNGATASLVAMDPSNGHVVAIANKDPFGYGPGQNQQNYAVDSYRNEGSTYKAITLATAFSNGYSPDDTVSGDGPCQIPGYPNGGLANNSNDGNEGGNQSVTVATANSVNCAFLRIAASLGNGKIAQMTNTLGGCYRAKPRAVGQCSQPDSIPSLTLGTDESSPLDMATVYNTIAGDGVRHDAVLVTKITDSDGNVVYQDKNVGVRVLDPQVDHTISKLLQGVITGGTGTGAQIGRPAAGKTGTNDHQADAWFDGYVPQLTAVVWMGRPGGEQPLGTVSGVSPVYGGSLPARIWHDFMTAALDGVPVADFQADDPSQYPPSAFIDILGRHVGAAPGGAGAANAPPTTATSAPPGFPRLPATTTTTKPPVTTTTAATTTTTAPHGP